MPNVLIIGSFPENPALIKGGVQSSVYGLARALKTRSDTSRVKVLSLPSQGALSPKVKSANVYGIDVTYLRAWRYLATSLIHLPYILGQIRKNYSPVVHIHGTGALQTALIAVLRFRPVKSVWTLHGITEKETLQRYRNTRKLSCLARHWFYKAMERFSLKIAAHVIVDTPYVREEIAHKGNVSVIPQGVFGTEFAHAQERHEPLVVSVGVFSPRKGHHFTIEAFVEIKKRLPEARLVIAGTVTDAAYHKRLKALIKQHSLSDHVELATNMHRAKLAALLARARVFALHSEEESQGIALCEALAAGLPVVATRTGGIPYVVTDGKDGLLVPYRDVKRFAASILFLLTEHGTYQKMSANAKAAGSRFDWNRVSDDVVKVYGRL